MKEEKIIITIQTPEKVSAHVFKTKKITEALFTLAKMDKEIKAAVIAVSEQFLMEQLASECKLN
jgi:hypothetical protein